MKSSQIYWGAIPWVVLQLIMVGIVIAWPGLVTALLDKPINVDLNKIEITVPSDESAPSTESAPKESDDDLEKQFRGK